MMSYLEKVVLVGKGFADTSTMLTDMLPDQEVTVCDTLEAAQAALFPEMDSTPDELSSVYDTPPATLLCVQLDEDGDEAMRALENLACLDPMTGPLRLVMAPRNWQAMADPMVQQTLYAAADVILEEACEPETLAANITLCLRKRRQDGFQRQEVEALQQLNTELYDRNSSIERELTVARQLQHSLLPNQVGAQLDESNAEGGIASFRVGTNYESQRLKITSVYVPCDALGGDLFDVVPLSRHEDHLAVSISDVSGHGLPAGFITAIYKAAFSRSTNRFKTSEAILDAVNQDLSAVIKTDHYVTAYCATLRTRETPVGSFDAVLAGAGHPHPILYRGATQTIERPGDNGPPLVWMPDVPYESATVSLFPGDALLLFTDGITEMWNAHQEIYGEDRLEGLMKDLCETRSPGAAPVLRRLLETLSTFAEGHPLQDDMSILLVEVLGESPEDAPPA
jgi:serine phosphatase RsbU (regulator of sigma subunit)